MATERKDAIVQVRFVIEVCTSLKCPYACLDVRIPARGSTASVK
jgi:hypothetical protein